MGDMIAAIYARVSTEEQAAPERYGLAAQKAACEAYAKQHGMVITGEYLEQVSGAEASRTAFEKLLKEAPQYQAVIMYDQSRLARDVEIAYAFLKAIEKVGLEAHSTQRGKLERNLMFGVEAIMNEEERDRIKRRTIAGRIERAMQGKLPIGVTLYGYRYDKNDGSVSIYEPEARVVRELFRRATTEPLETIRRSFDKDPKAEPPRRGGKGTKWWHSALRQMLRSPTYRGEYTYRPKGLEPIVIPVPAIVTPEEWEAAQRPPKILYARTGNPLIGYLRCGVCGHAMASRKVSTPRRYQYRCITAGGGYEPCGNGAIMCSILDTQVEARIRELLEDEAAFREAQTVLALPAANEQALKALDAQQERLTTAYVNLGVLTDDEYKTRMDEIKAKREAIGRPRKSTVNLDDLRQAVEGATLPEMLEAFNITVRWKRLRRQKDGELSLSIGL